MKGVEAAVALVVLPVGEEDETGDGVAVAALVENLDSGLEAVFDVG